MNLTAIGLEALSVSTVSRGSKRYRTWRELPLNVIIALSCLISQFASIGSYATEISFELLFNRPSCKQYTYQRPIETYGSVFTFAQNKEKIFVTNKTKDIYCAVDDFPPDVIRKSHAFRKMIDVLNDKTVTQIDAAFYLVESTDLAASICERNRRAPLKVNMTIQLMSRTDAVNMLENCLGDNLTLKEIGCNWLVPQNSCSWAELNTMHTKILRASRESDSKKTYVIGSGNLNHSLYGTRDVWAVITSEKASRETEELDCILDTVLTFSGGNNRTLTDLYSSCSVSTERFDSVFVQNSISSFLLPTDNHKELLLNVLPEFVKGATEIALSSQDIGGKRIFELLQSYLRDGGKIRVLLDDDWYWVLTTGDRFGMASYDRAVDFVSRLETDYPMRFQVRYLETDNSANFATSVHHKFLVARFPDGTSQAIFGSANMKDFSYRSVIENVHFVTNSEWASFFWDEVDYLWDRALTKSQMPIVDSGLFQ